MKKILTIAAASVIFVMNANASTTPTKTIYEMEKTFEGHSLRMSSEDPATLQSASAKLDSAPASHGSTPVPTPSTASQEQLHPLAQQLNAAMKGMPTDMPLDLFLSELIYGSMPYSEDVASLRSGLTNFLESEIRCAYPTFNRKISEGKQQVKSTICDRLKDKFLTGEKSESLDQLASIVAEYHTISGLFKKPLVADEKIGEEFWRGLQESGLQKVMSGRTRYYNLEHLASEKGLRIERFYPMHIGAEFVRLGRLFGDLLTEIISGPEIMGSVDEFVDACFDCLVKKY